MRIRRLRGGLAAIGFLAAAAAAFAGDAPPDPAAELKKLDEEYRAKYQAFIKPWADAKTDEERAKLPPFDMEKGPAPEYLPRYLDIARRAKGTDAGVKAAAWLLSSQLRSDEATKAAQEAVDLVVEAGADSPAAAGFAQSLRYQGDRIGERRTVAALQALAEKSKTDDVKAAAMFNLGALWTDSGSASDDERKRAHELLAEVCEKHAQSSSAKQARGYLNQLDLLRVGMTAPDFEAEDVGGVKFKLSDYRGKVVMLDFWGFW